MKITDQHREKYAGFLEMIEDAKRQGIEAVLVAAPWVIGDNYDEVMTNLGLLAGAGLALIIASEE